MGVLNRIVESKKRNNNLLSEYCNFNRQMVFDKTQNGSDAFVEFKNSQQKYLGNGAVKVHFDGTSEVKFTNLSGKLVSYAKQSGFHYLSVGLWKSDPTADVDFGIELKINGTIQTNNIFDCNLFSSSQFVDGEWNVYEVRLPLVANDQIDFIFKVKTDTVGTEIFIDRFMLELEDRGLGQLSLYEEAPLSYVGGNNILSLPVIPANSSINVSLSLLSIEKPNFIVLNYPTELNDLGLIVSMPIVNDYNPITDISIIKFIVYNPTNALVTPPENKIYSIKKV